MIDSSYIRIVLDLLAVAARTSCCLSIDGCTLTASGHVVDSPSFRQPRAMQAETAAVVRASVFREASKTSINRRADNNIVDEIEPIAETLEWHRVQPQADGGEQRDRTAREAEQVFADRQTPVERTARAGGRLASAV